MEDEASAPAMASLADALQLQLANATELAEAQAKLQTLLHQQTLLAQGRRQLEHKELLAAITQSLEPQFQASRPSLSLLIHRCLLRWGSLGSSDAGTQVLLAAIIDAIRSETDEDSVSMRLEAAAAGNSSSSQVGLDDEPRSPGSTLQPLTSGAKDPLSHFAYWLTVTTTLLSLIHKDVPQHPSFLSLPGRGAGAALGAGPGGMPKPGDRAAHAKQQLQEMKEKLATSFSTFGKNLFKRGKEQGSEAGAPEPHGRDSEEGPGPQGGGRRTSYSGSTGGASEGAMGGGQPGQQQPGLGAPTPAQVFRHHLDTLQLQCFTAVRDNLKKQLTQLLPACIQAPLPAAALSPRTPPARPAVSRVQHQVPGAGSPAMAPDGLPVDPAGATSPQPDSEFGRAAQAARLQTANAAFSLGDDEEEEEEDGSVGQSTPAAAAQPRSQATSPQPPHLPGQTVGGGSGVSAAAAAALAAVAGVPEAEEEDPEYAAAAAARNAALAPWADLVAGLQSGLQVLREANVPRIHIKCLYKQVLGFVNLQLFNQLLLRPECCCASNARAVLQGLKLLDSWVLAGADEAGLLAPLYSELRHVRQAANFLVAPAKRSLTLEDITGQLCPALNSQQVYRLCTTFWDDAPPQFGPAAGPGQAHPSAGSSTGGAAGAAHAAAGSQGGALSGAPDLVSGEVLEALLSSGSVQGNGGLIVTFLLDDDPQPIIAPQGCTAPEVLQLVMSPELLGPMALPLQLVKPSCPREVFAFVEEPVMD